MGQALLCLYRPGIVCVCFFILSQEHYVYVFPSLFSFSLSQWGGDLFEGEGTINCATGWRYSGQWRRGKQHGEGEYMLGPVERRGDVYRPIRYVVIYIVRSIVLLNTSLF